MSDRWEQAHARAIAYVMGAGDPLERLRAGVLAGEVPVAEAARSLIDSGALAAEDPADLLPALSILDGLDQLGAAFVEPTVIFLADALGEDGAWGDPASPLEARIVATAMLGGYLTKTLRLRPRVRAAVDGFLARTWNPDRVKTGDVAPIAAYAHWFSVSDSELSDPVLQWCGRELERGFRTRHFDAVATARVFLLCHAVAVPGASLTAGDLCEALANEQTEEGGFALSARALAGAPVEAALDAILAWSRLSPAARAAGPCDDRPA